MSRIILLLCVVLYCLLIDLVRSERFARDFGSVDLFGATKVDGRFLTKEALIDKYSHKRILPYRKPDDAFTPTYQKLDNLLLSKTDSEDPNVNLNVIMDELVAGYKNKIPSYTEINKGARLVAALTTLKGDNECGYYSQIILLNNFYASELDVISIKSEQRLRRIDKILVHFIKQHIGHCEEVYFRKFDELSKELDAAQMKHLDGLFRKAIDSLTSESEEHNHGKSYAERLFNVASEKTPASAMLHLEPSYSYDALKELVRGDPDEKFLKPIKGNLGSTRIRWDKFNRTYEDYVVQPCYNLRQKLGPEIFEPLSFDSMFGHVIRRDRVDFYEVWLKYRLCNFDGSARDYMDKVIGYANNL